MTVVLTKRRSEPLATSSAPRLQPEATSLAAFAGRKRLGLWAAVIGAVLVVAGGGYAVFVAMRPPTVQLSLSP